jgi:hypothetical protein
MPSGRHQGPLLSHSRGEQPYRAIGRGSLKPVCAGSAERHRGEALSAGDRLAAEGAALLPERLP